MSKLLHKPLKAFTVYALLILTCSIPVYYFIVDSIWIEELDEHNQIVREQTQHGFQALNQTKEELKRSITLWNTIRPEATLIPVSQKGKDSVYNVIRSSIHNDAKETDRFRGLITFIQVDNLFYQLTIETNFEEADETILAIAIITCLFISLLIAGFVLLNKKISEKIWTPFTDTLEKLKTFDLNQATAPVFRETNIAEFNELNRVLSKLIENNLRLYHQQKEFTQNASHELQTPLALLKSKIDLFIQDPTLNEEQRQVAEALAMTVSRINRINKNLLLLTEIENRSYSSESVDVQKLLLSLLDSFREFADNKSIMLTHTGDLCVKGNESLIEILLNNLLSNALRYTPQQGKISAAIQGGVLTIRNTGIAALKPDALFKRFSSVSSQSQGTGLGLAIVKEICTKYNWDISYHFYEGEHTFSIKF